MLPLHVPALVMVEITISKVPYAFQLTPEACAELERMRNPQDLNDALALVRFEACAKGVLYRLNKDIEEHLLVVLFPPKPQLGSAG